MRVSQINHQEPKRTHNVAKAAAGAAGVAVTAGTILYLAQKGKLNPTENGNKHVETLKAAIKKPADKVLNSTVFKKISGKISNLAGEIADNKTIANIKTKAAYTKDVIADKIESVFNKEKFNPEKIKDFENLFE